MLAANDALLSLLLYARGAVPRVSDNLRDLAATYLGGRSLAALAGASLVVEHRRGALLAASAAFGWPVAPF